MYALSLCSQSELQAILFGKIGHFCAVCITPIFYTFSLEILGKYKRRFDVLLCRMSLSALPVFIYFAIQSPFYIQGVQKHTWGYYIRGGPLMLLYASLTFAMAVRVFFLLGSAAKLAGHDLDRASLTKFRFFILALAVYMPACSDYLPKFGINFFPIGFIFSSSFALIISYGIVRLGLIEVDYFLRRSFVYSTLIFILTLISISIIWAGELLFRAYFGYKSIIIAFFISVVLSTAFNPLRTKIQSLFDRFFFNFDPQMIIKQNEQMKTELQDHDRLKSVSTLAAGMAHEIKNPLTSIRTFAEFLPRKYDDPEFRQKFSNLVVDEVDRVNSIIQQLLDFSKPRELDIQPVDVGGVINETLDLLSSNLLKNKVGVEKNIETGLRIPGDARQLKQVFINLFLNAIQAMPTGGTLKISSKKTQEGASITVEDTGLGIPKEHLPHIFDPFFTTKEAGSGLGLAVVHGIILRHGGEIKAENGKSGGAEINVFLRN